MRDSKRRFWRRKLGGRFACSGSRQEETAWDTKGPAYAVKMRGGLDAAGQSRRARLRGARCRSQSPRLQRARHGADRAADGIERGDAGPRRRLHAHRHVRHPESAHGHPRRVAAAGVGNAASHRQPARSKRTAGDVRVGVVHRRTGDGRQGRPGGVPPQAAGRPAPRTIRGFKRARSIAVVKAAAEKFGWDARPSPKPRGTGDILTGRGIAYAFRSETVVGADRRGRGEPRHRPRVGEAIRVRARLRPDHQSRGADAGRSSAARCTRSAARSTKRSASTPKR